MQNNKKIILDLCGGTGSWSKPYKNAGYKVLNLTLPEYDVTKCKFEKNEILFPPTLNSVRFYTRHIKIKDVYGILAAPPCTEFSKAKSTKPRNLAEGMKTIRGCMEIIWHIQENGKLQFWALENPVGLLRRFLGNPPYSFKQWWFGNNRNKHTDLWGRFNIPKRKVFNPPADLQTTKGYFSKDGKELANRNAKWYSNARGPERAITPEGFAKEFYKANK
ncbi:MAG: hypothetical protein WC554_04760 [Clostridia bacterium]|jgi:site-specific DNA-cytosine methylase